MEKYTVYDLRHDIDDARTSPYFFDRNSMEFFGDTMVNYGVRSCAIKFHCGDEVECWEVYRRKPVKLGLQSSAYFCKKTFRRCFGYAV